MTTRQRLAKARGDINAAGRRYKDGTRRRKLVKTAAAVAETAASIRGRLSDKKDVQTWVRANRYINGERWTYESAGPRIEYGKHDIRAKILHRPYLRQYVEERAPIRSSIKPRQSEFTENQINENLFYAVTHAAKVSHIFPTDELGDAISNEKIGPAIRDSPAILEELVGQGHVRRYEFRSGGMYTISGALKRAGGRASSRDILVFDEWDFMPATIEGVYGELLSHSRLGLIRKISTPTVPGIGIDKTIREGCGYEWHVTCPKCKKQQVLTWPDNLIGFFDTVTVSPDSPEYVARLDAVYIGCNACGAYLDRNSAHYLETSRWIAARPELAREHASYLVTAGMIPWKTGRELLRKYHVLGNYVHQWYNEVWGTAYLKADNRLTMEDVLGCAGTWNMIGTRIPVLRNVSVGVDWGEKQSWVVVSAAGVNPADQHKRCIVFLEEINSDTLKAAGYAGATTDHVDRLIQIARVFNADIIVNDANGIGIDRNKKIIDTFQDRAWGAFFDTAEVKRQATRQSTLLMPQWTAERHRVVLSKTHTLKEVQGEFRARRVELPTMQGPRGGLIEIFARHCRALAVQPRWNVEYEREFEIAVKVAEEDHFADANMYSKIGFDKLRGKQGGESAGMILSGF